MPLGRFRSTGATHPGALRAINQDALVDRPDIGLWAVADGAGGHTDGAAAANLVAETLATLPRGLPQPALVDEVRTSLLAAHTRLRAGRTDDDTSATTIVALVVDPTPPTGPRFTCLWAGDSRAYLLRAGTLERLTRDHSLVQELLDAGRITEDEANQHPRGNIITRAIGAPDDTIELDIIEHDLLPGDRFLLCSDGLFRTIPEPELATHLAQSPITTLPSQLLATALTRQARDNVTAITIEFTPNT